MEIKTSLGMLEQSIMSRTWELTAQGGEVTGREIFEQLKRERKIAYTTVATIMNRLVDKGLLMKKKVGKVNWYTPMISRQRTVKSLVHQTLQALVNQFGQQAITAFADELNQLSERERRFFSKEFMKGIR